VNFIEITFLVQILVAVANYSNEKLL